MRQDPAAGELAGRITLADFPGCRPALLNGRHLRRVIAFTRSPLRPAPHTLRHSRYRGELSPGRTKPCAMEEEPGSDLALSAMFLNGASDLTIIWSISCMVMNSTTHEVLRNRRLPGPP